MNLLILTVTVVLLLAAGIAAAVFYAQARSSRRALQVCSDLIHGIFKSLEETSSVTRILSQDPPEEELRRLQDFILERNQKAVIENESLWGIMNNLPDGIVAADTDFQVVACNRAFCRLMDMPEAQHNDKKVFQILRHHAPLQAAEDFLKSANKNFSEIEFVLPSEKWIRLKMFRVSGIRRVSMLFVFSDISGIKKLENMRRDFVANVSHELRTPLTSIQGFVETLLGGASEEPDARNHFLSLMHKDTQRLGRLIEDLLELSKIENQSQVFKKEKLNAAREIKEVLELFLLRCRQKKIQTVEQIEPNLEVYAHKDQFRQVLINILDNAVKFTPENGTISLSAVKSGNAGIEIRITDSGPGVRPENKNRIFQRFFREDKARSRETGGTGLGLSIVKHIMEAHHGRVHCEPGPDGKGTAFVLFFAVA